jgi:AraC-like DNA-binding protein
MITAAEITPSPALMPFVRCYRYREFDTIGKELIIPWHAFHEMLLTFHFQDWPTGSSNPYTGQVLAGGSYGGLLGLGTQFNGKIRMNGRYAFLEIVFRSNGFHRIFFLPAKDFNNFIVFTDDIFDREIRFFYEQLCAANNLSLMGTLANTWLISYLKKQKHSYSNEAIEICSNYILKTHGLASVEKLAFYANMSPRNFERRFVEQVGVSPKLLCCTTRFNHALLLKLKKPRKPWSIIADESGYFDQMHLVKDFKRFAGTSPAIFLQQTPLSEEIYASRVE